MSKPPRIAVLRANVFALITIACGGVMADETRAVTADIAELVRAEFDGARARETVALMDRFVRWPGNTGFDTSIDHIGTELEAAGFVDERRAGPDQRLVYRIESYPMDAPAWEPLGASVHVAGDDDALLDLSSNRNMLARHSDSTAAAGVTAELVYAGNGSEAALDRAGVRGRIVLVDWSDAPLSELVSAAVIQRGALGVLAYDLPSYLKPEINRDSIQFRGLRPALRQDGAWAISLSFNARTQLLAALQRGPVQLIVRTRVRWIDAAVERTVVANLRGSTLPHERFVVSAHVQEPGANDNASGVAAQLEMARVAAKLLQDRAIDPTRTLTFLWGDEIVSTRRYVTQDKVRAKGIRWGLSLDMVGEDTAQTGGTFLIEKMPDPSAIWTRGEDRHTEWGGEPLGRQDMTPHYLNDVVLGRALEQAAASGWEVRTNPFEGGSDHVPFLQAGIPGVLLWHFTDQFYHTDRDRLDKVSAVTLKNTGVTALVTGLALTSADERLARGLIDEVAAAAIARIAAESKLSLDAIRNGAEIVEQRGIVTTWRDWYDMALAAMSDIEVGGSGAATISAIAAARRSLSTYAAARLGEIDNVNSR